MAEGHSILLCGVGGQGILLAAKIIGADSLGYLSVENVKQIAHGADLVDCCTACFDGDYPTDVPLMTNKSRFERKISEAKSRQIWISM